MQSVRILRGFGLAGGLALAALALASCLSPEEPGSLRVRVLGPSNPRPRCAKGAAALGHLDTRGDPVEGALLHLDPGGFTATTDSSGEATLTGLPEGEYHLSATATGFRSVSARDLTVASGEKGLSLFYLLPCIAVTSNQYRVGFGVKVVLEAKNACGAEWDGAELAWTQVEGPDVRASFSSPSAAKLAFKTRTLAQMKVLPDEQQILAFSPDEAGQYVFRVTGTRSDGASSSDYAYVTSTDVTGGMNSVPTGLTYTLAGSKQGPWKWWPTQWPTGWISTLADTATRTPTVTLLPPEELATQATVILEDKYHSSSSFSFVVGTWNGVNRDCGRAECHYALQRSWEKTLHASTWRKLLDGEISSARGEIAGPCAACHALGYDLSVDNGGYDDVARDLKAKLPDEAAAGTYAGLPKGLKDVSNVYCLACHGPARVDPPMGEQPGRFAVGVCARCHDRSPEQDLVAQWKTSRMSMTARGDLNGPESREECASCHTAQGFYYKNFALGRPLGAGTVVMICCENTAPITCQTCHSPMYASNKAQVFRYGNVQTTSGLSLSGIGSGALCSTCHQTEHNVSSAKALAERLAPHSPQAELSYGRAGFTLEASTAFPTLSGVACSKSAGEGCVTCHMDKGPDHGSTGYRKVGAHTFRMTSSEGVENLRPCQACHSDFQSFAPRAGGDYDGDGRIGSVREEYDGLVALLAVRLAAAISERGFLSCGASKRKGVWFKASESRKLVVVDELGFDLGDCDASGAIERKETPRVFGAGDSLLHKAAYNYLLLEKDKSHGLHNFPYAVKLLQRTLYALAGGKGLPGWTLHR
jgi:hypothetical protein